MSTMKTSAGRSWRALSLSLALLPLPLAAGAPEEEPLGLAEAAEQALAHNPDLAVDLPGIEAARLQSKAARAGYLPRVDFEQAYEAGNNPVFVFGTLLGQQRFTAANFALEELNTPDALDNLKTRVTAEQVLWDFGRTRSLREQAETGIAAAESAHEAHRQRVLMEVLQAYYAHSLARSALDTAAIVLGSAEAIENQARARVESGLAVDADLLRSRVYLSEARQRLIQAEGELESARAHLNRLMGRPLDLPTGATAPLTPTILPPIPEEPLLAEQKRRRADYRALVAELRQAEALADSRAKEFYPVVAGFGAWEANHPSLDGAGGNNWSAGLALKWNLFAGGRDAAALGAARRGWERKKRQVEAMESAMALEIRRALIRRRAAERQVQAALSAEGQSEEGLRILQNRYEAGLATMTDLLSAEAARAAARTRLAEAVYRYRVGCAEVEYAAGTLDPSSPAMSLR